ncbi:MAG: hypothetical protein JNK05_15910 [Myxococcales bacterium]|nr:hypothetical protein [Myxococcales bacterium]
MSDSNELTDLTTLDPVKTVEELKPMMAALDPAKLHPGNFDVGSASSTVLAHRDEIEAQRGAIDSEFKRFDFTHIDNLEKYAVASKYLATIEDNVSKTVPEAFTKALADGTALRAKFSKQAATFIEFEVFDSTDAAVVREIDLLGRGYEGTSQALIRFSALFLERRAVIEGKMPMSIAQVEAASKQGMALGQIGKEAGRLSVGPDDITDLRRRAVTLLATAWQEIRWAMDYVRRHEKDSAKIVPGFSGSAARAEEKAEPDLPEDKKEDLAKGGATPAPVPPDPSKPPLPDAPFKR